MKNHREILEALLAGYTIQQQGENVVEVEWVLDKSTGNIVRNHALATTIPHFYDIMRIKHKTININGFEVPEPVKQALEEGTRYYVASLRTIYDYAWKNDHADNELLRSRLIHLTKEAAKLHKEALLSFMLVKE
jgi:hypothetical protein